MANILVVGGAGYIGSHMVLKLLDTAHDMPKRTGCSSSEPVIQGCKGTGGQESVSREEYPVLGRQKCTTSAHNIVVLDNLSTGHAHAVHTKPFIIADLADTVTLDQLFTQYTFDAVMHFASYIQVGESVQRPDKYYQNNVCNTLNLLNTMVKHHVKHFIFSSTAAIFGEPQYTPIDLQHPKQPMNPYGMSKWMVEQILQDYDRAYGMKSICLRYFNAAGADPDARIGEEHDPETHLIPLVLQVASGRRDAIHIFGTDYDTPDGTCIRDYIHINDLCDAHLLALDQLLNGADSAQYNLGNGTGFSVREVIDTAQVVTGKTIPTVISERRPGDPARLVADSNAAKTVLDWKPQYPELTSLLAHAWSWEQHLSNP